VDEHTVGDLPQHGAPSARGSQQLAGTVQRGRPRSAARERSAIDRETGGHFSSAVDHLPT